MLGIVPGELPEMDAEKFDPCSRGEVLTVVKTEIIDSTDFPALKIVEFSTTVSLVSQSWLVSNSSPFCNLIQVFNSLSFF